MATNARGVGSEGFLVAVAGRAGEKNSERDLAAFFVGDRPTDQPTREGAKATG